ncbi:hypothetical protein ASG93_13640 [Paenibacillus sp. Soil787]|nr:hypothetical protein ASG93_13640 [Paenibacillus sp. Soil787]
MRSFFSEVESIWMELCKRFNAWYGQCHLFSNSERSNNYLGWGFGRCISRLHWKTYFGKEYYKEFDISSIVLEELCTIIRYCDGDFFLTINADPEEVVTRNKIEREIIKRIGKNYFGKKMTTGWIRYVSLLISTILSVLILRNRN